MPHLVAVATFGNTSCNGFARISETLKILFRGRWPRISLALTLTFRAETERDCELLAKVSLKIHVGVSDSKLALCSNEIETKVLLAQTFLKFDGGQIRKMVEILQHGFLGFKNFTFFDCLDHFVPSLLVSNVGNIGPVDFARILALNDGVPLQCRQSVIL
jgi:hypothetical protein